MNSRINSVSLPIRRGDVGRGVAHASDWKQREALLLASLFGTTGGHSVDTTTGTTQTQVTTMSEASPTEVDPIAEANQSNRVTLPEGDITQHQHGVKRMVEEANVASRARHHPPTINHENDPLTLIGLEIADRQFAPSGSRSPVN